jgi:hypothetical protein
MMSFTQQTITLAKRWRFSENGLALTMALAGACFIVAATRRFWIRPGHVGLPDLLGCAAGAFGGFFLLLVTDYLLQHARLVFIPWVIALIFFAVTQPHLGVGMGLALWYMLGSQLRGQGAARRVSGGEP